MGIYPKETTTEKEACTPGLITALATIARPGRQSNVPQQMIILFLIIGNTYIHW